MKYDRKLMLLYYILSSHTLEFLLSQSLNVNSYANSTVVRLLRRYKQMLERKLFFTCVLEDIKDYISNDNSRL